MRLSALILVATAVVLTGSARAGGVQQPQATPGEAVFVVSGRGWGHGVGMSQYGAYGMAKAGSSYAQILGYYYTGTKLGRTSTDEVRVLLAEGRPALTISSALAYSVVDAAGTKTKLSAGPLVVRPKTKLPSPTGQQVTPTWPLVFRAGKAPLSLDGRLYRGTLEVSLQGRFLRVVNDVRIEDYVQGVVSGEMPHTWPLEALKAQAVAARSYALANLVKGKPFDLYSDQRSQVYLGLSGEKPETSTAVQATAGQVVLYGGRIASTLYFSSSGGRTASSADVFGVPVPYLVSRPDPWDKLSPFHHWGPVVIAARTAQSKLDVANRIVDASGVPTPSGRMRTVTFQTTAGPTSIPAALVRTSLGLRSTWISIGVLRLDRPTGASVFGAQLEISGLARGLRLPMLASSSDGVAWKPVGPLTRGSNGSVWGEVTPPATMRYRIEVKGAASPAILVPVASRVRLARPTEPGFLGGTVRPKLAGAPVAIERLEGASWAQVAKAVVGVSGAFQAKMRLVSGSYRARVAPANGLSEGLSPALTVTG